MSSLTTNPPSQKDSCTPSPLKSTTSSPALANHQETTKFIEIDVPFTLGSLTIEKYILVTSPEIVAFFKKLAEQNR